MLDAHGDVKHLECVGVNLLDEPDVGGVVITSRDVSERQRLSELLAHRATHDAFWTPARWLLARTQP